MRIVVVAAIAALGMACGRRDEGGAGAPRAQASAMDEPHVVFTRSALTIDRLEVLVPAPVTAPSQPSPATLASDAPGVVSIDDHGRLVAHSRGRAVIRATGGGGGTLAVDVVLPELLEADPPRVVLAPGGSVGIFVRDEGGRQLPESAVVWDTSAPNAVVVSRGNVHAFSTLGQFEVTARVGDVRVAVPVLVSAGGEKFEVTPGRATLKQGEVALFRVTGPSGPATAEWRSDRPRVLSAVGQGLFQALGAGSAQACARVGARKVCAHVEVTP